MHSYFRRICIVSALISFIFAGMATRAAADIYIWTDQNGIRHVSNIAPPSQGHAVRMEEKETPLPQGERFRVVQVFDGDTIQVNGAGLAFRVRLVGIDTPETGRKGLQDQPFSQKARDALAGMILDKDVVLTQYGTGGYNRILAEVFSDGLNINLEMLRMGLAEVYQGRIAPALDIAPYKKAQAYARQKNLGIWSLGKRYKSPRQWRKENPRK